MDQSCQLVTHIFESSIIDIRSLNGFDQRAALAQWKHVTSALVAQISAFEQELNAKEWTYLQYNAPTSTLSTLSNSESNVPASDADASPFQRIVQSSVDVVSFSSPNILSQPDDDLVMMGLDQSTDDHLVPNDAETNLSNQMKSQRVFNLEDRILKIALTNECSEEQLSHEIIAKSKILEVKKLKGYNNLFLLGCFPFVLKRKKCGKCKILGTYQEAHSLSMNEYQVHTQAMQGMRGSETQVEADLRKLTSEEKHLANDIGLYCHFYVVD